MTPESDQERVLEPDKDADEIIRLGIWESYANKIITNGKWKCYRDGNKVVAYTFKEAAEIEEHQRIVTARLLRELYEQFEPMPPLHEKRRIRMNSCIGPEFNRRLSREVGIKTE